MLWNALTLPGFRWVLPAALAAVQGTPSTQDAPPPSSEPGAPPPVSAPGRTSATTPATPSPSGAPQSGAAVAAAKPAPPPPKASASKGAPASKPASASAVSDILHTRILVILQNGQKITGVAKRNRFVERARGFDFSPAEKADDGAGIRVWYANPGQNYLFISYKDIATVHSIGNVSDVEVKELEAKAEEEARAARERAGEEHMAALRARLRSRDEDRQAEEKLVAAEEKKKAAEQLKSELKSAYKLLAKFPPDEGWSEDRRDEVLAKKLKHVTLTPTETDFLKVFEEWAKAKKLVEDQGKEPPADGEKPEKNENSGQKPEEKAR
ncbi:MAG: hypothetical protein JNJ88_17760 [Planctomycetes bacterium]|nr:hypothetical protein [Planctomycetota bacterium]